MPETLSLLKEEPGSGEVATSNLIWTGGDSRTQSTELLLIRKKPVVSTYP